MARRLSEDKWLEIKTDYQLGLGIRDLERKYRIAYSTLKSRKDKEGWTQKALEKLQTVQNDVNNLAQEFDFERNPYASERLKTLFDTQLEAFGIVKDASMMALKIHRNITTMVHNGLANKTYKPEQGAAILKMQGLDVGGSLKVLGFKDDSLGKLTPQTDDNKLVIEFVRKE